MSRCNDSFADFDRDHFEDEKALVQSQKPVLFEISIAFTRWGAGSSWSWSWSLYIHTVCLNSSPLADVRGPSREGGTRRRERGSPVAAIPELRLVPAVYALMLISFFLSSVE